jgi:hypothetical protein
MVDPREGRTANSNTRQLELEADRGATVCGTRYDACGSSGSRCITRPAVLDATATARKRGIVAGCDG